MDRKTKIIIGIFVTVLIGIVVTEIVRPKPLNWKPSYTATDKIPFGCFVLFNELPNLFSSNEIISVDQSLYLTLKEDIKNSSYLMVNNGIELDEQEYNQILDYVSEGNNAFIASSYFGHYLSDTLNVQVQSSFRVKEDTVALSFTNKKYSQQKFIYSKGMYSRHFSSVDTVNTTVLGRMTYTNSTFFTDNSEEENYPTEVNFIKVKFGNGYFYLNSTPLAFSNFYMLGGNQDYVANSLAYLGEPNTLYWDNYKKSGRIIIDSPLRFVLSQTALKWAYYLMLVGVLLFYIFKTKRQQRIIPVVEPLQNSSIEFAQTVGSLYYQNKDYTNLIAKKLNYFLAYIRSTYYLETSTINAKTAKDLAAKSGKPLSETTQLISYIKKLKKQTYHTENDIVKLNKIITDFKK